MPWAAEGGELGEVAERERLLDVGDALRRPEPIAAELRLLDLLELLAELVELALGQRVLPRGEHDRVLARRVVAI